MRGGTHRRPPPLGERVDDYDAFSRVGSSSTSCAAAGTLTCSTTNPGLRRGARWKSVMNVGGMPSLTKLYLRRSAASIESRAVASTTAADLREGILNGCAPPGGERIVARGG